MAALQARAIAFEAMLYPGLRHRAGWTQANLLHRTRACLDFFTRKLKPQPAASDRFLSCSPGGGGPLRPIEPFAPDPAFTVGRSIKLGRRMEHNRTPNGEGSGAAGGNTQSDQIRLSSRRSGARMPGKPAFSCNPRRWTPVWRVEARWDGPRV
jgi:hypothetical protein